MISIQAQHDTRACGNTSNPRGDCIRACDESTLSDGDLIARLVKLRGTERTVQRRIVAALAEMERRRLYLPRGYGSLFEFCIDYLKYSRSSAARRIAAARCIARFPRMASLFEQGKCDLTVLSVIAGAVTKENCAEIAAWLPERSLREVEAFVRQRHPERLLRDQVRQVYVTRVTRHGDSSADRQRSVEEKSEQPKSGAECEGESARPGDDAKCKASFTFSPSAGTKTAQPADNKSHRNRGVQPGLGVEGNGSGDTPTERVVVERKLMIHFAVEPAFMEKYKKVLSFLSTKYPGTISFEMAIDILMTDYLDRHSPESKMKRREQRRANKKMRGAKKSRPAQNEKKPEGDPNMKRTNHAAATDPAEKKHTPERTRHIPQEVRDQVYMRDGGRCTFVGTGGRRCTETRNLEIDHIIPYAKGGSNEPENLRLLCARHNILEAERAYGSDFMEKFKRRE